MIDGIRKDFKLEHWRCKGALVSARNGAVEIINLGDVEKFLVEFGIWRPFPEENMPVDVREWLNSECRLRALPHAAEIESDIRAANECAKHRPDCALGGGDFGSINYCTSDCDKERSERRMA